METSVEGVLPFTLRKEMIVELVLLIIALALMVRLLDRR